MSGLTVAELSAKLGMDTAEFDRDLRGIDRKLDRVDAKDVELGMDSAEFDSGIKRADRKLDKTTAEKDVDLGMDTAEFDAGHQGIVGKLGKLKMVAAAAGAAAGAALIKGMLGAMEMEKVGDKMAAQLGLTEAQAERRGGIVGKLYAGAWGESVADVGEAVSVVMSSIPGMMEEPNAAIEAATVKAIDYATAFDVDLTRSVAAVGVAINQDLVKNANQGFDLLVAASQKVPAALYEDLVDSVEEYSQYFSRIGMSGEQMFTLLVEGAKKGRYGIDKVGDAVKEFTIRSTDLSTASQEAYSAIGLSAEEMTNKILAGGDSANVAFQQIIEGLLSIKDPGKQAEAAIALFGTPIEDLGVTDIPVFLKSLLELEGGLGKVEGAADRMGNTLNDNATVRVEALKRKIELALVKALDKVITFFDKMSKNKGVQAFFRELGETFAWVGEVARGVWPEMQRNFVELWAIVGPLLRDLWKTTRFVVGGIVKYIKDNWGTIGPIVKRVWEIVKSVTMGPLKQIAGVIRTFLAVIRGDWSGAWEAIKSVFAAHVKSVGSVAGGFKDLLLWIFKSLGKLAIKALLYLPRKLWGVMKSAGSSMVTGLKAGASRLWGFLRSIPGRIVRSIGYLGNTLWGAGNAIIQGFYGGLKSAWTRVANFVSGIGGWIADHKGPLDYDRRILRPAGQAIMAGLTDGLDDGMAGLAAQLGSVTRSLTVSVSPNVALAGSGASAMSAPIEEHYHIHLPGGTTLIGQAEDVGRTLAPYVGRASTQAAARRDRRR